MNHKPLEEIYQMKKIWRGNEIPIASYLMSFQDALRKEFLDGFDSLEEACKKYTTDNLDLRMFGVGLDETIQGVEIRNPETGEFERDHTGWKSIQFKYGRHDEMIDFEFQRSDNDRIAKKYPTAHNLVKEYGDFCPIANYSILSPQTILHRHSGPENREGKYLRIHIPLIIPEGDVFLEASGEEVTWDNIWGFNNQHTHSAYNMTDEWRVVFMIDLDMAHIGMEPQAAFDPSIDLAGNGVHFNRDFYKKLSEKYGSKF
jgi:hypothetical protein